MKLIKTAVLATVVAGAVAAAPAMAAPVINYNLTITGANSGSSADTPTFLLTNTSTYTGAANGSDAMGAYLTSLQLSFSGSSFIDRLTNFTTPTPPAQTLPALTYNVSYPDGASNATGTPGFLINFGGFNAGEAFQFAADFDLPGGANANYRSVLAGSTLTAKFANGTTQSLTLNGFNATSNSYSFSGSDAVSGAVPEPATWAMMILGMGAVGFAMRRRQKGNVTTTVAYA
jgi:hypothetical protein